MDRLERLSAQDLMAIWPDDFGWPEDIGAIALLEGKRLFDPDGHFRIDDVRAQIATRLHLVPRLRQIILQPRLGLGWPLWVDAPSFDLGDHVKVLPLRSDEEAEILSVCEELRRYPLDRSRPLWEIWFLPSLESRRVAVYFKIHHAIADGMAGVAALGAFLDLDAQPGRSIAPEWTPTRIPSNRDLLQDNLRQRIHEITSVLGALLHPVVFIRRLKAAWPGVREAFGEGRAPRVSVNGRVGAHRRLALIRSSLERAKGTAHEHSAKVNDVLLAAVAGGLRELLETRGEDVNLTLRAFVPVSLHRQPDVAKGNLDGAMIVSLPVDEPDPFRRLTRIAAETSRRKRLARPNAGTIFRNGLLQRAFLRYSPHQRMVNVYVANVPGPPMALYFAGAPVLEVFPVVPIVGNIALGIGALSYAGQFNITIVADRERLPDIDVLVGALRESLARLTERSPVSA